MKNYRELLEKKKETLSAFVPLTIDIKKWIKEWKEDDVNIISYKKDKNANMWSVEIDIDGWSSADIKGVTDDIEQDGGSVA